MNHLVKLVILLASLDAETADSLAAVANLTWRTYGGFIVVNTLAVAERDEGFVPVSGGGCFCNEKGISLFHIGRTLLWRDFDNARVGRKDPRRSIEKKR